MTKTILLILIACWLFFGVNHPLLPAAYRKWLLAKREKRKAKEAAKRERKGPVRYWIEFIGSLVLFLFFFRAMVVEAYRIPTGSMERTLLVGDFLLVNKMIYGVRTPDWIGIPFTRYGFDVPSFKFPAFDDPEPGDIVVFKYPGDPMVNYIKRIVAGPGQTLEVRDKHVYVDGEEFMPYPGQQFMMRGILPADYQDSMIWPRGKGWNKDQYGPLTIPEDCYFVMGDNRDNSADSRYWGFLPRENIVGRAWIIYFSFDQQAISKEFWKTIRFWRMLNPIE